eukprot:TRINITY_DN35317_c0_g2_i2.p1 TRINITY_DN35317_c0_g2~~TRINITY_DN35317_c0_g2_i2.p1  ORF type:complete len:307 (+),score=84.76 TRINITY_DN35317_c0_g2_i2:128-1048(+)
MVKGSSWKGGASSWGGKGKSAGRGGHKNLTWTPKQPQTSEKTEELKAKIKAAQRQGTAGQPSVVDAAAAGGAVSSSVDTEEALIEKMAARRDRFSKDPLQSRQPTAETAAAGGESASGAGSPSQPSTGSTASAAAVATAARPETKAGDVDRGSQEMPSSSPSSSSSRVAAAEATGHLLSDRTALPPSGDGPRPAPLLVDLSGNDAEERAQSKPPPERAAAAPGSAGRTDLGVPSRKKPRLVEGQAEAWEAEYERASAWLASHLGKVAGLAASTPSVAAAQFSDERFAKLETWLQQACAIGVAAPAC